jgi:putrescine:ornithine antiporter
MGVTGLTVLVAVNIMGSGIIMLPSNMAKIGSISILSWLVSAIGAMALAYSFAVAGYLVPRSGGISLYAEEGHGKSGFFMTSYNYFFCLVVGDIAIAVSAIGYLSSFIPWLGSTPVHTCIGVIASLWLTTIANFWGARITSRFNSVSVWGVIIPVASLAFFGWFWFDPSMFAGSWNIHHVPVGTAITSGISLTLWAFIGMESACICSDTVDNPKRNVPIACLVGTGFAAVVYMLSTSVIQGIVPNQALANSNAPFGLAFATLFTPAVGQFISMLAILACLGSLLGWQFTMGQIAKSAADIGMFPKVFGQANKHGVPVRGLLITLVMQTVISLMTISPDLNQQFNAVVNLAVFNNVVPYLLSLTPLALIMKRNRVEHKSYVINLCIAAIALLYTMYSIYSLGQSAVFWGCLIMLAGYLMFGLLAPHLKEMVAVDVEPATLPPTEPAAAVAVAKMAVTETAR